MRTSLMVWSSVNDNLGIRCPSYLITAFQCASMLTQGDDPPVAISEILCLSVADEGTFMTAYKSFWKKRGEIPKCQMTPRLPVNPWVLWREVHAWGGSDVVHERKVLQAGNPAARGGGGRVGRVVALG
jgi:hypothetical protein